MINSILSSRLQEGWLAKDMTESRFSLNRVGVPGVVWYVGMICGDDGLKKEEYMGKWIKHTVRWGRKWWTHAIQNVDEIVY